MKKATGILVTATTSMPIVTTATLVKKKTAFVFSLATLVLVVALVLAGCSGTSRDEKVIKDNLTHELDQLKDPASAWWTNNIRQNEGLLAIGLDPDEFKQTWISGFDYKIGAISVKDDIATVELTIICKQLNPIIKEAEKEILQDPGFEQFTQEQADKKVVAAILEKLDNATPTSTTLTLTYTKVDNTWVEDGKALSGLEQAMNGGTQ